MDSKPLYLIAVAGKGVGGVLQGVSQAYHLSLVHEVFLNVA